MANPKRKHTKSRRDSRRAQNWKLKAAGQSKCSNCGGEGSRGRAAAKDPPSSTSVWCHFLLSFRKPTQQQFCKYRSTNNEVANEYWAESTTMVPY